MLFGMTNGVACFQSAIDRSIHDENLADIFACIDKIAEFWMKKEDHDKNLVNFLNAPKNYGLTLKEKSTTELKELRLSGYKVSYGVTKNNPETSQPLKERLTPRT